MKSAARIVARLDLMELRFDFGPGYRAYAIEQATGSIVILLCGGDKGSQFRDIAEAKRLAAQI